MYHTVSFVPTIYRHRSYHTFASICEGTYGYYGCIDGKHLYIPSKLCAITRFVARMLT